MCTQHFSNSLFRFVILKYLLPLQNYAFCVGLLHKTSTKHISICGCNVTQYGKVQGGVGVEYLNTMHVLGSQTDTLVLQQLVREVGE